MLALRLLHKDNVHTTYMKILLILTPYEQVICIQYFLDWIRGPDWMLQSVIGKKVITAHGDIILVGKVCSNGSRKLLTNY